uniref:Putative secreted protein n=1 Tax=Panstrongylus lignarius TaxID=156445 RepID=A0A224Y2P9_9HEMI
MDFFFLLCPIRGSLTSVLDSVISDDSLTVKGSLSTSFFWSICSSDTVTSLNSSDSGNSPSSSGCGYSHTTILGFTSSNIDSVLLSNFSIPPLSSSVTG